MKVLLGALICAAVLFGQVQSTSINREFTDGTLKVFVMGFSSHALPLTPASAFPVPPEEQAGLLFAIDTADEETSTFRITIHYRRGSVENKHVELLNRRRDTLGRRSIAILNLGRIDVMLITVVEEKPHKVASFKVD